ncbi:sulfite oxidase heme-binding subunit YedZ [Kordiimonas sp. SCSIO 12610]|uniref:sulfite oxidase heme-binding subunit YedZ n=1 Tax=Kordiimonas sp. SCSIO 12610 TaxID=2829597 RepID=UPI00210E74CD|nr:protein-methionine-sulfoxide reductase heme-binding subunit MsrQ [Kordiimonas sp. SCSIO 12610]UTW55794.1 sulfoxide reductase heme-binding subunit YedZ [Kordiimonas sp. SCSIO 12610]
MAVSIQNLRRYGKPAVFALLALPALWLGREWYYAYQGLESGLGWNPVEAFHQITGDWAIRILLLSLAISPLSKVMKSPKPILFRRMIGLFAFFYVCLHLLGYVWLDKAFVWPDIWQDILKRKYITVGAVALILLVPLAVTSTQGWIKRLGARNWQKLHKSVYVIGILAVAHFIMMRKGFQLEPLVYAGILGLLFMLRSKALMKKLRP